MTQQPTLVAVDRFETGGMMYAPGTLITDTSLWPEGAMQTRLDRGSIAYAVLEPKTEEPAPKPKRSR